MVIIGAGHAGVSLFQMLQEPASHYRVCGFVDDDPATEAQVRGFSDWLGTIDKLPRISKEKGAD